VACKGLDEQVVRQDKEIEPLEREFVCVRLVQMKGVDLELFQFDYDQTWAAFFLNADGTIYGRYGTRAGNKNNATTHVSLASFKRAMQRALELRNARQCIHCHNVREDLRKVKSQQKRLTAADIWVYPLPENVGLKMDVDDALRVAAVTPNSPAEQAGPGEDDLAERQLERDRLELARIVVGTAAGHLDDPADGNGKARQGNPRRRIGTVRQVGDPAVHVGQASRAARPGHPHRRGRQDNVTPRATAYA
jgi:hypothetical protein